jgi:hypothetical protein
MMRWSALPSWSRLPCDRRLRPPSRRASLNFRISSQQRFGAPGKPARSGRPRFGAETLTLLALLDGLTVQVLAGQGSPETALPSWITTSTTCSRRPRPGTTSAHTEGLLPGLTRPYSMFDSMSTTHTIAPYARRRGERSYCRAARASLLLNLSRPKRYCTGSMEVTTMGVITPDTVAAPWASGKCGAM